MQAKNCALITTESGAKIWRQLNAFKLLDGFGCSPFEGGGSILGNFLFYVPPSIVGGGSVLGIYFVMHYLVSILVLQSS